MREECSMFNRVVGVSITSGTGVTSGRPVLVLYLRLWSHFTYRLTDHTQRRNARIYRIKERGMYRCNYRD